ncbi:MAG TPA: hypothetical protein VG710_16250 [Opitutus sp.]|nr:hypothetical protein [Opitutus sp.]
MTADATDNFPGRIGRFAAGFALASFITVAGCVVYGGWANVLDAAANALPPAVFIGAAVGVLSAFRKRWLSFFIQVFARFGF